MPENEVLTQLLRGVFDYWRGGELPEWANAEDYVAWKDLFAFHFSDWVSDVEQLHTFFQNPEAYDIESASGVVYACLTHMPAHINAAARLLLEETDLCDPFADHGRKTG